jgi:hypothetical protein
VLLLLLLLLLTPPPPPLLLLLLLLVLPPLLLLLRMLLLLLLPLRLPLRPSRSCSPKKCSSLARFRLASLFTFPCCSRTFWKTVSASASIIGSPLKRLNFPKHFSLLAHSAGPYAGQRYL